jgi:hypothetical protein
MFDLPDVSARANVTMEFAQEAQWRLAASRKEVRFRNAVVLEWGPMRLGVRQAIQDLLRSAGVYRGSSTGELDSATMVALVQYAPKNPSDTSQ